MLVGLGLYREKFYTTNMIYGFGTREYLATGYHGRLQGSRAGRRGYSWREFGEDMYMGLSYKAGIGFTRAGYLMGGFSLGSFIDLATGQPWTQYPKRLNYTQGWTPYQPHRFRCSKRIWWGPTGWCRFRSAGTRRQYFQE